MYSLETLSKHNTLNNLVFTTREPDYVTLSMDYEKSRQKLLYASKKKINR